MARPLDGRVPEHWVQWRSTHENTHPEFRVTNADDGYDGKGRMFYMAANEISDKGALLD